MSSIGADGATLASASVTEASFTVSVSGGYAKEGDSAPVPAVFTVTVSPPQAEPVLVTYDTVLPWTDIACSTSWPTPCAEAGKDYAHATGSLMFAPRETVKIFAVPVLPDDQAEITEGFPVLVSTPGLASPEEPWDVDGWSTRVYGAIEDDDAALDIAPYVRVVEGNSGTRSALVDVRLSTSATTPVTVDYATATDFSYMPEARATAGEDYQATSGRLTFAPGEKVKTIAVKIYGDHKRERDESFLVRLSNPTNATIWHDRGYISIANDD